MIVFEWLTVFECFNVWPPTHPPTPIWPPPLKCSIPHSYLIRARSTAHSKIFLYKSFFKGLYYTLSHTYNAYIYVCSFPFFYCQIWFTIFCCWKLLCIALSVLQIYSAVCKLSLYICQGLAYVVSLPVPVRLTTTQIKHCPGHRPLQFLYQSTHRHPFITRGVFPEWSHKYLYGKTSNLYTSRSHGRPPLHPLAVHPSMHLSDPGGVRNSVSQRWRPV